MLERAFRKVESINVLVRGETGMVEFTGAAGRHNAGCVMYWEVFILAG